MSAFNDPFDKDKTLATGCPCGKHATLEEHQADAATEAAPESINDDDLIARCVETAVVNEVFGGDINRRNFLTAFGAGTAAAAISQFFPLGAAKALAAEMKGPLEKSKLKVGFVPITCATPVSLSHSRWIRVM